MISFWGNIFVRSRGELPEWPMGTDCKSVGESLRRFESYTHHQSPSQRSLLRAFVDPQVSIPHLFAIFSHIGTF
jgi:hypothetical protein